MNVTFICIGDEQVPSTRLRVLSYLPYLKSQGIHHKIILSDPSSRLRRNLQRLGGTLTACRSDMVLIQKITLPVFMIKWMKRFTRIVYDFDDAVYLQNDDSPARRSRLRYILRHSDLIVAGNRILAEHARRYNANVIVLPTPVPVTASKPPAADSEVRIVLGWIGSAHNLYNIDLIKEPLTVLFDRNRNLSLHLVSDGIYRLAGFDQQVHNIAWDLADEQQQVAQFDIGIMPLVDSEWNRGKCAYKAIQMMAQGIPVVASPVGMNRDVIQNENNGFLADSTNEWLDCIQRLIDSRHLRDSLGARALQTVTDNYALNVTAESFCDIFRR